MSNKKLEEIVYAQFLPEGGTLFKTKDKEVLYFIPDRFELTLGGKVAINSRGIGELTTNGFLNQRVMLVYGMELYDFHGTTKIEDYIQQEETEETENLQ